MATLAQRRAAARARLGRSRSGRAVLGLTGRTGHMLMAGGIGAAAQIVGEMAGDKISFVKDNWYGEPAALGLGAFLLIRRKPTWAYALAGAAGYSGTFRYKLDQFQLGKRQASPVPTFQHKAAGGAPGPGAGYYQNAGAPEDYANAVGF